MMYMAEAGIKLLSTHKGSKSNQSGPPALAFDHCLQRLHSIIYNVQHGQSPRRNLSRCQCEPRESRSLQRTPLHRSWHHSVVRHWRRGQPGWFRQSVLMLVVRLTDVRLSGGGGSVRCTPDCGDLMGFMTEPSNLNMITTKTGLNSDHDLCGRDWDKGASVECASDDVTIISINPLNMGEDTLPQGYASEPRESSGR